MLTIEPSSLRGEVFPPSSKSITHRAYILAGLVGRDSTVERPLASEDTDATLEILERMGAKIAKDETKVVFETQITKGAGKADCKNSGTTMRLMTALNALYGNQTLLFGDASLNKRPMLELINALEQLGAKIGHNNGFPPLQINQPIDRTARATSLDASKSSQFLSALLIMAAAREGVETTITLTSEIPSKPYTELTEVMLKEIGANVLQKENQYSVSPTKRQQSIYFKVPTDYSSAAFFVAAGAMPGNSITVRGLEETYPQADSAIVDFVKQFGAEVKERQGEITVSYKELRGTDLDLRNSPDIFPILSVLAGLAKGATTIQGAHHLKYKETDRIKSTGEMMKRLGIRFVPKDDGAVIHGSEAFVGGGIIESYGDHRIAMAATVAASQATSPITLVGEDCVGVSYRSFFDHFKALGGKIHRRNGN